MHANTLVHGRSWYSADSASLTDFGDCFRANLFWDDGGEAYVLFDTDPEALDYLAEHGFSK